MELTRLFLHLTAATIWVGGQLVLGALVPALRGLSPEAPAVAARAFARVAWPAFGVLVVTGVWNAMAISDELHGSKGAVFGVKMVVVLLSGLTAFLHQRASSKAQQAVWGAGTGTTALVALALGLQLTL